MGVQEGYIETLLAWLIGGKGSSIPLPDPKRAEICC
jgi:hypothetical protein